MHPRPRADTTTPSAPSFLCCILVLSSTCRFVLHRIGRLATPHARSLFREPAAAESRSESAPHTRGSDSMTTTNLPTRPLGTSGLEITSVGLGSWANGGGGGSLCVGPRDDAGALTAAGGGRAPPGGG